MIENDTVTIDCNTCVATGTTACNECIVGHLLANDGGPIDLVVAGRQGAADDTDRVVGLLVSAGLVDDPPRWITADEFAFAGAHAATVGLRG